MSIGPYQYISESKFFEKHECDTCKEEIGYNISKILILENKDGGRKFLSFHFFFPCWDIDFLCQKYPNMTIDRMGFSFPQDMTISKNSISKIKKNLEYWV